MNDRHETDTGVFKRAFSDLAWLLPFRKYLTPSALWIAIGILASGIIFVGKRVYTVDQHQESITGLQQERQQDRELLQKIDTQIAVMGSKVDNIANEVDRQREWRERIEDVAEAPPHARRRK